MVAFLSGGIDSSVIVGLMARHSTRPVQTYTIGFQDMPLFDERSWAREVARFHGTEHREFALSARDVLEAIPGVLDSFDDPFADSSALPTYIVSRETAKSVKVALSGDGGDELFAGYRMYAGECWSTLYNLIPGPLRRSRLRIEAGFAKLLPERHPYIQTYLRHQQDFGGANRVLVALVATNGDLFTPEFFDALRRATDEVFFLPGVDRSRVQSLFTPNVRYTEVVEDGIAAGNVIPDDFEPTREGLAAVRKNILKAGIVGRLVAHDFSDALISAQGADSCTG